MDEKEFQKLAKALINYDMAQRKYYEYAYNDIENVIFFSKFRIGILLFAVGVNVISILLLNTCYMDLNVILAVMFIISCICFGKKCKVKNKGLNELEKLRSDSERRNLISVMDGYVDLHSEWGAERWWKTLSGMEFGKHDRHYNEYRVTLGNEQLVTEDKMSKIEFHIMDDIAQLHKELDIPECRCLRVSKRPIEDLGLYCLIPLYFAGSETEDRGRYFTGRYVHVYYRIGTLVSDKEQNVVMILLNCNHVKGYRFLAYGAIPMEGESAENYAEVDCGNIDIPIEEVLVKIGRAMKYWGFHLEVKFNMERQKDFTPEEWTWWMYGQYDDWKELFERCSFKEYEDGSVVRSLKGE